jgi:hypothetical protein
VSKSGPYGTLRQSHERRQNQQSAEKRKHNGLHGTTPQGNLPYLPATPAAKSQELSTWQIQQPRL